MSIKIVNPFTNIKRALLSEVDDTSKNGGTYLSDLRELNIGNGGNNVFRADKNGIWLGSDKFSDAPFRVSMSGALIATSATISGFITVGGAASDVNSNSTTISGGKITANSISADKMVTNTLVVGTNVLIGTAEDSAGVTSIIGGTVTASFVNALNITAKYVAASVSLTSPSIYGGTIAIGSSNSIFKADSNGIYLGNATFSSAPFRVSMSGAVTCSNISITGGTVQWSTISSTTNAPASNATVGATFGTNISGGSTGTNYVSNSGYMTNITADSITTGTINADRIAASSITATKLNVTSLSSISASLGTITSGTIKVSSRIGLQKSNSTNVGYLGLDPDSTGFWGFIAERGYGFSCKYSSGNYFRIFMDGSSTDAVIDMPSPNKIKIQDNEGNAIGRWYGRNAGFSGYGGLDMFGPIRLFTASNSPSGASEGMMFYNTTYHEVWVYRNGYWKALAFVA